MTKAVIPHAHHYKVVPFKAHQLPDFLRQQIIEANKQLHWSTEQTQADFENEYAEYYVIVNLEELMGYVGLHKLFDEVSINTVYIAPDYRQQQLGTQLLQFVCEQLNYRQVKHLFLEVRASNISALALYRKAGFIQIAKRNRYYTNPVEDAIILQKALEVS